MHRSNEQERITKARDFVTKYLKGSFGLLAFLAVGLSAVLTLMRVDDNEGEKSGAGKDAFGKFKRAMKTTMKARFVQARRLGFMHRWSGVTVGVVASALLIMTMGDLLIDTGQYRLAISGPLLNFVQSALAIAVLAYTLLLRDDHGLRAYRAQRVGEKIQALRRQLDIHSLPLEDGKHALWASEYDEILAHSAENHEQQDWAEAMRDVQGAPSDWVRDAFKYHVRYFLHFHVASLIALGVVGGHLSPLLKHVGDHRPACVDTSLSVIEVADNESIVKKNCLALEDAIRHDQSAHRERL